MKECQPGDILLIKEIYILFFEVEFPKKIPDNINEKLEKILPPKQKKNFKIEKDVDYYDVTLVEPVFEKQQQKKQKDAYMEDDEEDREHSGGGGIQCPTQ